MQPRMERRARRIGLARIAAVGLIFFARSLAGPVEATPPAATIVFADFESSAYGDWKTTGTAFGDGPADGALEDQMAVPSFAGQRCVTSFHGGDASTGTLTSPSFQIDRRFITLLVGGGGFAETTCVNLVIDATIVRSAAGTNTQPGGSEELEPAAWEVGAYIGHEAHIEIVDAATGGWGHINVDQIIFTDEKPATPIMITHASRSLEVEGKWLNLPVKNGAALRRVTVSSADGLPRSFDLEVADGQPDWWAALDLGVSKIVTVDVGRLPESSKFFESLKTSAEPIDREDLYTEPLRPQLHFSASRGWINDPNGMVYVNGQYHLFFQWNPYSTRDGQKHWGHAVSKDLVHWRELGVALAPDAHGDIWSGSAVIDTNNTSGLGKDGKPPMVLAYTESGSFVQCLASSIDGVTFEKFAGNPALKNLGPGNRDPKVFWYEPTKHWVMVLYVPDVVANDDDKTKTHEVHANRIFTSKDMKNWTQTDRVEGFFECPELFPLAIDGDAKNIKWLMTGASSDYMLGTFDGEKFTPETPMLKGHRGQGFYAAQTFNDAPDGRRIMMGWFQTPSPGAAFNQSMSLPLELKLVTTDEGPRLRFWPVEELGVLADKFERHTDFDLTPEKPLPIQLKGDELCVRVAFEPTDASAVTLEVRGVKIVYDAKAQELIVNGHHAAAPLTKDHRQQLLVLADRNSFEVFASNGLCYVPMPVIADGDGVTLGVTGGAATVDTIEVTTLKSIWQKMK